MYYMITIDHQDDYCIVADSLRDASIKAKRKFKTNKISIGVIHDHNTVASLMRDNIQILIHFRGNFFLRAEYNVQIFHKGKVQSIKATTPYNKDLTDLICEIIVQTFPDSDISQKAYDKMGGIFDSISPFIELH
jgi:hypothetical protein